MEEREGNAEKRNKKIGTRGKDISLSALSPPRPRSPTVPPLLPRPLPFFLRLSPHSPQIKTNEKSHEKRDENEKQNFPFRENEKNEEKNEDKTSFCDSPHTRSTNHATHNPHVSRHHTPHNGSVVFLAVFSFQKGRENATSPPSEETEKDESRDGGGTAPGDRNGESWAGGRGDENQISGSIFRVSRT